MEVTYPQLFNAALYLADKYGMDEYIVGFDHGLVNLLLLNHIEKVKQADNYERCIVMLNDALSTHLSAPMNVNNFITEEQDRAHLYALFKAWRDKLLSEVAKNATSTSDQQSTSESKNEERVL